MEPDISFYVHTFSSRGVGGKHIALNLGDCAEIFIDGYKVSIVKDEKEN